MDFWGTIDQFSISIFGFVRELIVFLNYTIDFGEPIGSFSMWQLLGGTGLVLLLVAWLVKKVLPLL